MSPFTSLAYHILHFCCEFAEIRRSAVIVFVGLSAVKTFLTCYYITLTHTLFCSIQLFQNSQFNVGLYLCLFVFSLPVGVLRVFFGMGVYERSIPTSSHPSFAEVVWSVHRMPSYGVLLFSSVYCSVLVGRR